VLTVNVALVVILLMFVGVTLLAIEILVLPGFGVIAVLGGASILGAGVLAWVGLGLGHGLLTIVAGAFTAGLLFWAFPKTAAGRALVLHETQRSGRGPDARLAALVGKEGRALTPLRPAGAAEIDDRTVDVVTDGIYVEAGVPVRVAKVEGTRVVVEPRDA
jgi:membrane-bound serine protease (ClpP class)